MNSDSGFSRTPAAIIRLLTFEPVGAAVPLDLNAVSIDLDEVLNALVDTDRQHAYIACIDKRHH